MRNGQNYGESLRSTGASEASEMSCQADKGDQVAPGIGGNAVTDAESQIDHGEVGCVAPDGRDAYVLYDRCQAMLKDQYEHIHKRMTWLASLQGFLFAAVGVAWKADSNRLFLTRLIGILGLSVAALVYISFLGPNVSIRRIRVYWVSLRPEHYDRPDVLGVGPLWGIWTTPETLMPLVFVGAWAALLLFRP
jgi:hypothetical protein